MQAQGSEQGPCWAFLKRENYSWHRTFDGLTLSTDHQQWGPHLYPPTQRATALGGFKNA